MPLPAAVPAVPPTFHFKMRLVDSTGKAFEGKDYQLWWGGKLAQEGVTGSGGLVEAELDDRYDSGLVDVGERDADAKFVARWTIPLEVVPPPPPPPKPVPPAGKKAAPKPDPRPQSGWTDEPEPPPPMPQYPRTGPEDEEGWRRYQQQQKAWDEWEERRRQRMRDYQAQQRMSEEWRDRQRTNEELRRKYHESQGNVIPVPIRETPAPPMSPEEQKAFWERMLRARNRLHAGNVQLYELSWRLRNLGMLPDSTTLLFPVEGAALLRVFDALRAYAHKNKLKLPEDYELQDPDSDAMKALNEHVRKEHDG